MPRYSEVEAREAVAASRSYSAALRLLGLRPAGGNHRLLREYVDRIWKIPTDHFDPIAERRRGRRHVPTPLDQILVEHSSYSRRTLKLRLYAEGLKERRCELCGQGEIWHGRPMSLILDHINGTPDDNRLENLRIVCANCAATLDTHCGKKNRRKRDQRACELCGRSFWPKYDRHRFCSQTCGQKRARTGEAMRGRRKVERPPYEALMRELDASNYSAVGRRYGVSDNAVRKWVRSYEMEAARSRLGEAVGEDGGRGGPAGTRGTSGCVH
jgi:hypothetical protein